MILLPVFNGSEISRNFVDLLDRHIPDLVNVPKLLDLAVQEPSISIAALQNAGKSSGLRLVTRFVSTTTSASIQCAPALITSSLIAKKLVALRPFSRPLAEQRTHGPWQMAATNFPCVSISLTNWMA